MAAVSDTDVSRASDLAVIWPLAGGGYTATYQLSYGQSAPGNSDGVLATESGFSLVSDTDFSQAAGTQIAAAALLADSDSVQAADRPMKAWPTDADQLQGTEGYGAWPHDSDFCAAADVPPPLSVYFGGFTDNCQAAENPSVLDIYGLPVFYSATGQRYATPLERLPDHHTADSDYCRVTERDQPPAVRGFLVVRPALAVTLSVSSFSGDESPCTEPAASVP